MTELDRFSEPISTQLARAGRRLDDILAGVSRCSALPDTYSRYVDPPVRHLFVGGGKLLRPLLVLLSARATGDFEPSLSAALIQTAAAVELIHTASLAHDDMVDFAPERRGVRSLHAAFGSTTAVLIGDLFYSRFFQELVALPGTGPVLRMLLLDMFLSVTARMCEGEILEAQLRTEGIAPSFEQYLHITETKTADLVAACCKAGALLNGAAEREVDALGRYGRSLGLLFQIADDLGDGDSAFTNRAILSITADECRRTAETLLSALPENAATASLRELPAHILAPIAQ